MYQWYNTERRKNMNYSEKYKISMKPFLKYTDLY